MWLIKLPFKLIALIILIIGMTVSVFAHIAKGLSGIVIGIIMFVLFCMGVYFALHGSWGQVLGEFICGVGCMIFKVAAELLCSICDGLNKGLMEFVHS